MAKRIPAAPGAQYSVEDVDLTDAQRSLTEWADGDVRPSPDRSEVLRGAAAAAHGRGVLEAALGDGDVVERAMGGRPPLDPAARPGEHAPVRQVRLPASMNAELDQRAAAEGRRPSEIIRAALAAYLNDHRAS
jgi:hypothetical protein